MVAKRTSGRKPAAKLSPAIQSEELTADAVVEVLESAGTVCGGATTVDPEMRRQMVAAEAYLIAERRGFGPGHELDDWVSAEQVVDSRLTTMRAA